MIIDTHIHFYDPTRPQGVPWPPPDNTLLYRTVLPEHYQALARPVGVTGAVVVEASKWLADNHWILELADAEPFILGFVGSIGPNRPEFEAELARFAANPRFRGIRCGGSYFDDIERGTFLTDMKTLAARDLQLDVLVHEQHLDQVTQLAGRLPELRIVVNHIAHMSINGEAVDPAWHDRFEQLAEQPGIFMKVSAVMEQSIIQPAPTDLDFYRPALDALWSAFGPDRLIYGSNWPVCERAGDRLAQGLAIVQNYFKEKGPAAYDKYFWQNAQAVYKLDISVRGGLQRESGS